MLLSNQRHDQPRQMLLGHVVLHARRQKLAFIDLPGTKLLAHKLATNQTRRHLTSHFSDRLLAIAAWLPAICFWPTFVCFSVAARLFAKMANVPSIAS